MIIHDRVVAERVGLEKRCGYWEIFGTFFFDKSEMLRHASKHSVSKNLIKYHFFDSAYQTYNWSVEPKESLEELYKQRAQQLRDKYDYLILSFSGGADSSNILNAFIANGIKLDEIYCEYPIATLNQNAKMSLDNRDPTLIAYEWEAAAKPRLEKLAKTHPNIKITIEDATEFSIKIIESDNLHTYFRSGSTANAHGGRYHKLYEIARSRENYGKVCCLTGLDKPRIAYDTRRKLFFSSYSDFSNIYTHSPHYVFGGDPATIEYFYLTYDFPQLNVKQSYALKHQIQQIMSSENTELYKELLLNSVNDVVNIFDVHHDIFKKTLYKTWDNSIWQAKKSGNVFYTPQAQWFLDNKYVSDRTRDYFQKQLFDLLSGIDRQFIVYENTTPIALQPIMSTAIPF
jgi:hypothetical protein